MVWNKRHFAGKERSDAIPTASGAPEKGERANLLIPPLTQVVTLFGLLFQDKLNASQTPICRLDT